MERGYLMLNDGSSASCEYKWEGSDAGRLMLPQAFFTAHGETIHGAVLRLADGSERSVSVVLGPRLGEARFSAID